MLFILKRQEIRKHHSYQGETKWCKSTKDRKYTTMQKCEKTRMGHKKLQNIKQG
jgi:hypothetical protein